MTQTVPLRTDAAAAPRGRLETAGVRFPHLDALRALGATMVVATHVGFQTARTIEGPFSATLARLDFGVALFFVISGFLLFRPVAHASALGLSRPEIRTYLRRRAVRILPAYWLAVVLALVLLPQNDGSGPATWVRQAFLVQIYQAGWQRHGLTQTWSLCTEVAFYLLLPVLAALVLGRVGGRWRPKRAAAVLSGLVAVSLGWHVLAMTWSGLDQRVAGQWLPAYLSWFAAGMLLALAYTEVTTGPETDAAARSWHLPRRVAESPGACWVMACAVFAIATTPLAGPRSLEALPTAGESVMKNLLYVTAAVLLVLPAVFPPRGARGLDVLRSAPLRWLGQISYGIFLYHLVVLELLVRWRDQALFTGSWVELFLLTWILTVGVAALSYYVLERPLLQRAHRRTAG
jgi:peptidoglycan/LPS O-acetylase OafA/YrhL